MKQTTSGRTAAVFAVLAGLALTGPLLPPVSAADAVPPPVPHEFTPGTSYFGTDDHIEYLAGNLPVIFAAPHGGDLRPDTIPERTEERCGGSVATVKDMNTQELARRIQREFFERTGKYPHVVINRLHRDRLDANRDVDEAACGSAEAEQAWEEFHTFLDRAKEQVGQDYDKGWFTDLHGHGHEVQRLELGYLLTGATLRKSDAELDDGDYASGTSFHTFSDESSRAFSELLRGPTSLGTLFDEAGYPATPSRSDPAPTATEPFFSGGYNTRRHGCLDGGQICGVQIEHNRDGVRDTEQEIADYAEALYDVYDSYLRTNFGILVQSPTQGVQTLRTEVERLHDTGTVSSGHGTALLATLDSAEATLERALPGAERTVEEFRSQLRGLSRAGAVTDDTAASLDTLAHRVLQTMRA